MRIKRLEIHGFKSFADKMVLNFGRGITGVVGPNGCGKSNVVDSIRWCMGEMSAKHLRGRAMQDVIFSGSDSRGASNLAEVTLTFHNDGDCPPQYADFDELSVTRRLFRDGTSEYLVNKVQARLRDITDLFLGTGVGTRAYSIIEQGRMGFVVNAKPEERRSLIEEVAGITKFKARKRAAERRLSSTEQNLLRVNDILTELERQLASLRRQAQKAERYKRLKEEQRELELHQASYRFQKLDETLNEETVKEKNYTGDLEDAQAELATHESSIESDKLRLLEEEQELQDAQVASAEADKKLATLERDRAHWQDTLDSLERRAEEIDEAQHLAQAKRSTNIEERASLELMLNDAEAGFSAEEEKISVAETAQHEAQARLLQVESELDASRRAAMAFVQGSAQSKADHQRLRAQLEALDERQDRGRAERQSGSEEKHQLESELASLTERSTALKAEATDFEEQRLEFESQLAKARAECAEFDRAVGDLSAELSSRRSRLESFEEIARSMEGFTEGVRSLLGQGDDDALEGVVSVIRDLLEAPPNYELAIERALGEKLQYLLVEDDSVIEAGVALLNENAAGRSGFVSRNARPKGRPRVSVPKALGCASDLVTSELPPEIVEWLLGRVYLVDSLSTGLAAISELPVDGFFATLNGELIDAAGVVIGGGGNDAGLMAKRREIRELNDKVVDLENRLEKLSVERDVSEQRRLQAEVSLQQILKDVRENEVEGIGLHKDLESHQSRLTRIVERLELIEDEFEINLEKRRGLEAEFELIEAQLSTSDQSQLEFESQESEMQARRQVIQAEVDASSAKFSDMRIAFAALKEKVQSGAHALERIDREQAEIEQSLVRYEESLDEIRAERLRIQEQSVAGESEAQRLSLEAQTLREHLLLLRSKYDEGRVQLSDIEILIRDRRQKIQVIQDALVTVKMAVQKCSLERETILSQVMERHEIDLKSVISEYFAHGEPTGDDIQRKKDVEKSLKNIGPINVTAIEECEEIEERFNFLSKQREDLVSAIDELRKAINRINRTSRERFREAFTAVNEMFQKVFPRLFRGGEARLVLTESDDVLEAGVDIIAMPPGKKPQSLSLLSGGEKALTATSLVFSIFLIKPSPFCILDEVDAPLDDANVGRFCEMLHEISEFSQFIVITHDKQTMQQADRLYGITMEEAGRSKVVSVDLNRDDFSKVA